VRDLAGRVAFVPGGLLLVLSAELGHRLPDRLDLPVPLLLGVAAGVLWQSLRRKDIVDRLAGGAVVAVLLGLVLLLPGFSPGPVEYSGTAAGTGAVAGILSGMVLAEQWMRQRVRP
jgi:hypothetical protein